MLLKEIGEFRFRVVRGDWGFGGWTGLEILVLGFYYLLLFFRGIRLCLLFLNFILVLFRFGKDFRFCYYYFYINAFIFLL